MAEEQNPEGQIQFLLSDFSTRLRDMKEKNRLLKERILLLGKNLLNIKSDLESELSQIKKDNLESKEKLREINSNIKNIVEEISNFVKRDEIQVTERMIKDFQPLEFMRKKDVEEIIAEKLEEKNSTKEIKTRKASEKDGYT
jgi:hypothetical protein